MIKNKKIAKAFLCAAVFVLATTAIYYIYISNYYHADIVAIEAFSEGTSVSKQMPRKNISVYAPENADVGFIFYPGGKVECTAYEPLMLVCAKQGIFCVLVEMPGNLAVLNSNAANGIAEQYPDIEKWYIGGHSLGGSMAASYAAKHSDTLEGVVLLAAYSTKDLSNTSLDVLSVYGSEDFVLNAESYSKYKDNLPEDFSEVIIDGGCHSYFGMYGAQKGDGIAAISNQEQIEITAEVISSFLLT